MVVRRACVVRQHYVPRDSRVARAAQALAEDGFDVDVICLRAPGEPAREQLGAVRIRRVPLRHRQGGGAAGYAVEYAAFLVAATILVAARHLRRRYRLVQIHSLPDVLVLAGLLPRALGARVLLDLQECMPEFFATKFGVGPTHPVVRLLEVLEQRAIAVADHAITPTEQMRETFVGRGADPARVTTVMDGADPGVFVPPAERETAGTGTFTLISHGTVEEHYGLDTVLRSVARLRGRIPGLRLEVYGDGSDLPRLRHLAENLDIVGLVAFSGRFVPMPDLVAALGRADIGVLAVRPDPFRDVALPGKVFDFVAMGLPVVSSRTRSMQETFGDSVALFAADDPDDLAQVLLALHRDPARRAALVAAARATSEPLRWEHQRRRYLATVAELLGDAAAGDAGSPIPSGASRSTGRPHR
ncbi:glycosyltransferase [Actinomycetospora endophytica]|uniref:Glycosyltransferase n=1 Tax=Actinomycetospora endophytica TaxID=2291215 RepID=A0ABS8PCD3_9PSEU|nr:glycosyltransferase [Actinomycetospora endophytica]MCD2195814.1 glycosyltransferase [Actinomycetospora endophytica]